MSSDLGHNSSVFNNSCVKLPRNPKSNRPLPIYEQKYLNQIQNEAKQLSMLESINKKSTNSDKVQSLLEFYESIPEYEDMNHLSNEEFYEKLNALKEKQKFHCEYIRIDEGSAWNDLKSLKSKNDSKPFCTTSILNNRFPKCNKDLDNIDIFSDKPSSRRSVIIESPDSRENTTEIISRPKSSIKTTKKYYDWDDDYDLNFEREKIRTKSAPSSPSKYKPKIAWKDCSLTIPKPFAMTVRDEENKIVEQLMIDGNKKSKEEKSESFKAHPIPIESQIPLFDKIMADQELKNHKVRERSKALLQSQMRPFSFTKRDEEIQNLCKRLSKSSPTLYLENVPLNVKQFKAKPVPKNLFSNYIYKKMQEDEFYRTLQKRIRAEEMLKAASLPPSMAKREKSKPKFDVCPKTFRDLQRNLKDSINISYEDQLKQEFADLKNEYISTSRSIKRKTSARNNKMNRNRASSSSSSSNSKSMALQSLDLSNINRSNLAAVLRIQSARKRQETEMCRKLEESKLKEEARWREKLMRKKPIWQTLAYNHEEDLAMRLQMRRDEEKLRNEEHRLRMQLMLGRVNQKPTLFEQQSQSTFLKSKIKKLCKNCNYFDCDHNLPIERFLTEMKDESTQAFLDDENDISSPNLEQTLENHAEVEEEEKAYGENNEKSLDYKTN